MSPGPDDDRYGARRPAGPGDSGPTRPGLRPTKATTLIVAALITAGLAWLIMHQYFAQIPNVTWLPGLILAGLAVVEAIAAHDTKARVEQRPRSGALNPLLVARLVVLAKASSLAGSIFAGWYGGVAAWALSERGTLNVADAILPPSIGGLVGALALVAAALQLERAGRVPDPPDDKDSPPGR